MNNVETGIYYFSGTGNCLAAAKQLSNSFDNSYITSITANFLKKNQVIKHKNCFVVFPSYAYGMPSILYQFFKKIKIECDYLAAIITVGSKGGATLAHAKRNSKFKKIDYYAEVLSVENYIPIFGCQSDEKAAKNISNQKAKINNVIEDLKNHVTNDVKTFRPLCGFVSKLFRLATPILSSCFKFNACNNCGICEKICPVNAIYITKKPKIRKTKCQHCQGCINWCPNNAINFARMNKHTNRYHHPDVTLNEMISKNSPDN